MSPWTERQITVSRLLLYLIYVFMPAVVDLTETGGRPSQKGRILVGVWMFKELFILRLLASEVEVIKNQSCFPPFLFF